MELNEPYLGLDPNADDDHTEHVVPIKWDLTVDRAHAVKETGLFGVQLIVCKPRTPKWDHTVQRLKQVWNIE